MKMIISIVPSEPFGSTVGDRILMERGISQTGGTNGGVSFVDRTYFLDAIHFEELCGG